MLHALDVIGTAVFAFAGASLIVAGLTLWTRRPALARPEPQDAAAVFLFEGQDLVDATPPARRLLRAQGRGRTDLAGLLHLLGRGFGPDLARQVAAMPMSGRLSLVSATGAGTLDVVEEGGALRLVLRPEATEGFATDRLAWDAAQEELTLLRGLAEDAPQPIWTHDATGALTWANRAYLALCDLATTPPKATGQAATARAAWPAAPLFATPPDLPDGQGHQERLPLVPPGSEEPLWYDVTSLRRGEGMVHFATDVTSLVQAESARLHYVQTLAKTFAHLRTGLAIFDRDRRLVLFNPAFLDLTRLPVELLSGRPLVQAVLDWLRDAKLLPEPRDYVSWRESVAALEAAAAHGEYRETWSLPDGRTWRVTGRPHPDGALAFLFEDISDEVGLARRYRAESDSVAEVLDALEDAVAVFSATGGLTLSNAAYVALWGRPGPGLAGEVGRWEAASAPSPLWASLREGRGEGSEPSEGKIRFRDGRISAVQVCALSGGSMLVAFRVIRPGRPSPAPSGQPDAPAVPNPAEETEPA